MRVAVVTGAASGIGAATAALLEERGWSVVGIDVVRTPHAGWFCLDVTDATALSSAISSLDRVDGLVNNAALQNFAAFSHTSWEDFDRVNATNLRAPFVALKAAWPQLCASRGAVVNVSSVHALATSPGAAAYAASKGGLSALTRAAALELGPEGVRVNAVVPGAVDTEALRAGLSRSPGGQETLESRTPLGRIGRPAEVAEAVEFLLDHERSGFITGQQLVVDGGAMARLATE